jgi:hypothetical protein
MDRSTFEAADLIVDKVADKLDELLDSITSLRFVSSWLVSARRSDLGVRRT